MENNDRSTLSLEAPVNIRDMIGCDAGDAVCTVDSSRGKETNAARRIRNMNVKVSHGSDNYGRTRL